MALRQIVKVGDEILRERCREVTVFDEKLWQLLDDLKDTMKEENGVGIAAPQVGVLKRVCIVCIDEENLHEFVNPIITKQSGEQINLEGCLSVPDRSGYVKRPSKITIEAQDRFGKKFKMKTEEYEAIACCHEFDHLDGILYIDKIIEDYEPE